MGKGWIVDHGVTDRGKGWIMESWSLGSWERLDRGVLESRIMGERWDCRGLGAECCWLRGEVGAVASCLSEEASSGLWAALGG